MAHTKAFSCRVTKVNASPVREGPAGASDTMGVGIHCIGHVVIDHVGYLGNIDPPGGNVGCHEDLILAAAESVDRILPFALGQVSMQRGRRET